MKHLKKIVLILIVSLFVTPSIYAQELILLTPTSDGSTNELLIGKYFETKGTKYSVITSNKDKKDKWLKLVFAFEGIPELTIYVDNYKVNDTESRIQLESWPKLGKYPKGSEKRKNMLEFINGWANRKWIPQNVYITEKEQIKFVANFNIPGEGTAIHPEVVRDMAMRIAASWKNFYPEWFKLEFN